MIPKFPQGPFGGDEPDQTYALIPPFPEQPGDEGASPSATVEDETSFGITPNAGTSDEYSRGDHTHGTPPDPSGDPTIVPAIKYVSNTSSGYATALYEVQGNGTLSASVDMNVGVAIFVNILKNQTLQEQLLAGSTGTYTFTPLSVVTGDQVYVAWSNGGAGRSLSGSMSLSTGLRIIGCAVGPVT